MATRTVVCPECDAPLAPGRFACGECGALLATVASGSRSLFPPAAAMPPEEPYAPDALEDPAEQEVVAGPTAEVAAASVPYVDPDSNTAPASHEVAWAVADEPAPATAAEPQPAEPASLPAGAMWAAAAATPAPAVAMPVTWPTAPAPAPAAVAPSWPEHPAWPPASSANGATSHSAPVAAAAVASPADALRNPAGAYLPPSAVLPPAEALPLPSAKAATPARPIQSALADSVGSLTLPSDPPAAVISLGAGISAIGFLLPWADVVLGSSGMGSFVDRWGLAGPGHVVVFAALLGLAAVAAFSHRLPRPVRPGLPAVGLGFLLVGLAWPYLFGPFGATVGVYVITTGGLLLVLAGTLELVLRRHAGPVASV